MNRSGGTRNEFATKRHKKFKIGSAAWGLLCLFVAKIQPMNSSALVECVPNSSEGRDADKVQLIAAAISAIKSGCVLDTHIDPDHNRSVIPFVASPETVVAAAVNAVRRA